MEGYFPFLKSSILYLTLSIFNTKKCLPFHHLPWLSIRNHQLQLKLCNRDSRPIYLLQALFLTMFVKETKNNCFFFWCGRISYFDNFAQLLNNIWFESGSATELKPNNFFFVNLLVKSISAMCHLQLQNKINI